MDGSAAKPLAVTAAAIGGTILLFICLIAYLLTLPFHFFTADRQDLWELRQEFQGAGGSGAALAALAQEQYELYGGTACGSNYWPSGPEAWCCDFVYWCAGQLGYVGQGQIFGTRTGYCPTAVSNLAAAGAMIYYPGDGTIPQPGDIIFFSSAFGRPGRASDGVSTNADHVGIVVAGTETTVTIIEGNTGSGNPSASKLSKNTYNLTAPAWGSTYILSFFRPNYPVSYGSGAFLVQLSNPDPNYAGHPISLTASQRLNVCRALIGEQGTDNTFEIYVAECQYICDYIEYGTVASRSYDSIGHSWLLSASGSRAASYSQEEIDATMPELVRAVEYVFDSGGRCFQHIMGGYWDDDDEALGYSFEHNVRLTCGGGHDHEQVRLVNPNYSNEWVVYYTCANKLVPAS